MTASIAAIQQLVDRFAMHRDEYHAAGYNETQLRREFLDPFFEALGWDVDNKQNFHEAYKEVIHEDSIKIGEWTKAPDYCFRIGGVRKFFVEAKKPAVNIKDDVGSAYQVRRYAWSAKLPLSILTNFEYFAVYDCRQKPLPTDKASVGRVLLVPYVLLVEQWESIAQVFSREAIPRGGFDKFADSNKAKRGTAEVDSAFLDDIESWRKSLASNLAIRNESLTQRDLNFAVQRTIDRIIFLRICEDRGIEQYGILQALLNGTNVYQRLAQLFHAADRRYNSGLFHFQKENDRAEPPDDLTLDLAIDDKALKDIIKRLYYPECPYAFSVLGADILGHIYEQFLGKVIRLTAGHHAVVEDKPEVKKAGGVYYTPTYIVDYIVKQTVGALLENKTPQDISGKGRVPFTILDPACGSGSFLIGAYQYLLDWHLDYYFHNNPEQFCAGKNPQLTKTSTLVASYRLSTAERKRILSTHIYGVDIDAQAVETTKLSLLLKVLEGENETSIKSQLTFFHERALPDLGSNIKCGNSLIGSDFYDGQNLSLFDDDVKQRINAFDWKQEFPAIMRSGGFDAVVGNPPYGATLSGEEISYLIRKFDDAGKLVDTYCYFILQGSRMLKVQGRLSFIVPNTFCDLEGAAQFRKWILSEVFLEKIWQTGFAFKSAVVDTLVFELVNAKPQGDCLLSILVGETEYQRKAIDFLTHPLAKIDYRNTAEAMDLLNKVTQQAILLGELATVKAGVKMYEKGKGSPAQTDKTMKDRPFSVSGNCPNGWRILYRGENILRYEIQSSQEYVSYGPWLAAPRQEELFVSPKILMRRTDDRILSSLEIANAICVNSCHVIKLKNPFQLTYSHTYILGLLNSRLMQRVFELQNPQMVGKVFAEIKVIYVERLPIATIDFTNPSAKTQHDNLASLVENMLLLHTKSATEKNSDQLTRLQREIAATDAAIDKLVYGLYGLSEDEVRVVEGGG